MWNFEDEPRQLLTEAEISAGEKEDKGARRLPSNAAPPPESDRLTQLFAPVEERGRMPLTKERYVVRDNPHKVAWERQVRMFLRLLPLDPGRGHRISAVMIYEWATNRLVKDVIDAGGSVSPDLRKINEILRFYFGKSYTTWILGRKVPNAYKVPPMWRVKRHRPMTLTLWNEYTEGTLNDDGARRNAAQ